MLGIIRVTPTVPLPALPDSLRRKRVRLIAEIERHALPTLAEVHDVGIPGSFVRTGGRRPGSGRKIVEIDRCEVVHAG